MKILKTRSSSLALNNAMILGSQVPDYLHVFAIRCPKIRNRSSPRSFASLACNILGNRRTSCVYMICIIFGHQGDLMYEFLYPSVFITLWGARIDYRMPYLVRWKKNWEFHERSTIFKERIFHKVHNLWLCQFGFNYFHITAWILCDSEPLSCTNT